MSEQVVVGSEPRAAARRARIGRSGFGRNDFISKFPQSFSLWLTGPARRRPPSIDVWQGKHELIWDTLLYRDHHVLHLYVLFYAFAGGP